MKILGLISSFHDPASRARILQYIDRFEQNDVNITPRFFLPDVYANPAPWAYRINKMTGINEWRLLWIEKIIKRLPVFLEQYKYDLIWQNRLILPQHSFFEKKISKPIAFDFDDAIWVFDGKKKVCEAIAASQIIFSGNEYLADFAEKYNKNVYIIPSTIDTEKLFPNKKSTNHFTIGWIGSTFNFKYLDIIKPAIEVFLSLYNDTRFIVVSSEPPPQFFFDNHRILFKVWTAEEENQHINDFTIGLMPLSDDEFTRGKCSYKMLQYMACGIPVIVSPVGMNTKVLSQKLVGLAAKTSEEWISAFKVFRNDYAFYNACAENGRALVEKEYSLNKYTPIIIDHLKKLLN